jgi:hypothetical protein
MSRAEIYLGDYYQYGPAPENVAKAPSKGQPRPSAYVPPAAPLQAPDE